MVSICYETVDTFTQDEIDKYCDGLEDTSQNFNEIANQASDLYKDTKDLIKNNAEHALVEKNAEQLLSINDPNNRIFYRNIGLLLIMKNYKDRGQFNELIRFSEGLNPDKLNKETFTFTIQKNGREQKVTKSSDREKYYLYLCKAFLKTNKFEECLLNAQNAKRTIPQDMIQNEQWFDYYIINSKSKINIQSNNGEELEKNLKEVENFLIKKRSFFIYTLKSEIEIAIKKYDHALISIVNGINTDIDFNINYKWELFYKAGEILDKLDDKKAIKHAQIAYLIRQEQEWSESNDLNALLEKLNAKPNNEKTSKILIEELKPYWKEIQENETLKDKGKINRFIANGNAGFIRTLKNGDIHFNKKAFKNNQQTELIEGLDVAITIIDTWDNKRNCASKTAINCSIINS